MIANLWPDLIVILIWPNQLAALPPALIQSIKIETLIERLIR